MRCYGESVSKIASKVAEEVIHCAMALQVAVMRCEKYPQVLLRATLCGTKKLRDNRCVTAPLR